MIALSSSPKYQKFIRQRDRALERIHSRAQREISDILRKYFSSITQTISTIYRLHSERGFQPHDRSSILLQIQIELEKEFASATFEIVPIMIRMRRAAFILSYAGELEAMGRTLPSHPQFRGHLRKWDLDIKSAEESPGGGDLTSRVKLYLDRLGRHLLNAVQLSSVLEYSLADALTRIGRAFPYTKVIQDSKIVLRKPKLKEAGLGIDIDKKRISEFFVDEDQWNEIVDQYKREYVPKFRGPDHIVGTYKDADQEKKEWYAWELEEEVTQDFVYQVRQGQVEAAEDNGITDFVWISILDDRTDKCCIWRNGLTTKEIEHQLKTKRKDDVCQAVVPPAHFNCRCTLSPVTDEIPEAREPSNLGDFEEWLTP